MVDGEDLYQYLTTMFNLTGKLEEITRSNVINEDFMTTVYFSIMVILRYVNIVKIVMSGPILERANLNNKLSTTDQRHKAANKRPPELHTAIQALDKRKKKEEEGHIFQLRKEMILY